MSKHAEQLPLPLKLADPWPGFAQFLPAENAAALSAVQTRVYARGDITPLLLLGPATSGKSHLLGASMQALAEREAAARLLPLRRLTDVDPGALGLDLAEGQVLLDDLDAVIGRHAWEVALFALSNRLHDARLPLLCSSRTALADLDFVLPDLRSRLALAQCELLQVLGDGERRTVLRDRAAERGLELSKQVMDWLDVNYSRDLSRLLELLEELDQFSLSRGRRITVPLIRAYLADAAALEPGV